TTPVVGLNDTNHESEQWGSLAPGVVPIEANIQRWVLIPSQEYRTPRGMSSPSNATSADPWS
ncbi:hypothetical protein RCH16_002581, partial [Cryobacterium sp. MP_M5]|uniref:hypothetical protein n=1 Tax=unclassified Cryobacterium TaxID=2649013 RepID=UPI001E313DEB